MKRTWVAVIFVIPFLFSSCVTTPHLPPAPLPPPPVAPVVPPAKPTALIRLPPQSVPLFTDDADTTSLRAAAWQSSRYFHQLPPNQVFTLASDTYTARDLADSMDSFVALLDQAKTPSDWIPAVQNQFVVYQSAGSDAQGAVTFSSYYEPTISARLKRSDTYRYPMYRRPDDLIDVDLGAFEPAFPGARISGRRQGHRLVPYYTRADIDSEKQFAGDGYEMAWAKDPLDIFFLQIEGSGWLDLGNGRFVRIGYDGDNGRRFTSVGKYLIDSGKVSASGFGHESFKHYMTTHPQERQSILNVDERYVFFQLDLSTSSADAYGNIQVPLTPGRSIATDPKVFPKGLLAWIDLPSAPGHRAGGTTLKRFMLNQDEGGAIQGAGRVDFFAGHGPEAEKFATHLWHPGTLYFLVKKS